MINGERLAELRKNCGLRQIDLAERIGVTVKCISLYERERRAPPDDLKIKFSEFFGVSIDYLMGLTDVESYNEKSDFIQLPKDCSDEIREKVIEYISFLTTTDQKKK